MLFSTLPTLSKQTKSKSVFLRCHNLIALSVACLALSSCTNLSPSKYTVDRSTYHALGQSERIQFIVLHYTAETDADSLDILTNGNVSAHYLVPRQDNRTIYQLVAEDKRAWHAGRGGFDKRTVLNDTSIGIEISNLGIYPQYRGRENPEMMANNGYHPYSHYVPFTELQIEKVAQLIEDLVNRYDIKPTHVIGHSDMAPSRKIDPGARFPWERLYQQYGIGAWYDETDKQQFMSDGSYQTTTTAQIKQVFRDYGYVINDTEEWDRDSQNVIYAFQLHFRPHKSTGNIDLETYAILQALNKKYVD